MAQQRRADLAEQRTGWAYGGHQAGWNIQHLQQLGVPLVAVHIEQQGARGVADIRGMYRASGQLPDQPAVNGAKRQLARFGLSPRARHVVQQPAQLGAREIGIDHQPGLGLNHGRHSARAQVGAGGFGAPVLPDDGVVDGDPGAAVPDHGGLALIGDANGPHLTRCDTGLGQCLAGSRQLGLPDHHWVVLDPAGLGVDLWQFLLRHAQRLATRVEHDAARA